MAYDLYRVSHNYMAISREHTGEVKIIRFVHIKFFPKVLREISSPKELPSN